MKEERGIRRLGWFPGDVPFFESVKCARRIRLIYFIDKGRIDGIIVAPATYRDVDAHTEE